MGSDRLGPFEVLGPLARGGQGAVLRARDTRTGKAVALKLLLQAEDKAVRRFRQEAQLLARLEHPSIVRVVEHGVERGAPYLAMELVEGESLAALVARVRRQTGTPPTPGWSAWTLATVADALEVCHRAGVVHRDLKPENILVEQATGRPVLVDFGLARRDAELFGALSIDQASRLSLTGELRGTPAYMAPEQATPTRFGEVSPRTDVWGLCAVLHFALTGAPPFTAEGLPNLIFQLLEEEPPDPRATNPAVPEALARVVRAGLTKQPGGRQPSAAALADALRAAVPQDASSPVPARFDPRETDSHASAITDDVPTVRGTKDGSPPAASLPRLGSAVGPYVLEGLLGQGGMGTVFRARHRTAGVVRAVKLLSGVPDAARRGRFLREVTGLARVHHPNVVAIHEADVDGARAWFAMDLVEGQPLDRLLLRGRLPLDRALKIACGAARGVEALHALGIVHRDLKSQNLIVAPDDRAVVIDLGLAVDPSRDERLTRTGGVVGTVKAMAPEQLSGKADPRSDVWALGLVAFELLTGRSPVPEVRSATELAVRLVSEERPRIGDVDPELPAALEAVIARALSRRPDARFARAGALADALEAAVSAPGPTVREARRRRRRRLGAAAGLVLASGAAAFASLPAREAPAVDQVTSIGPPTSATVQRPPADEAAARRELRRALDPDVQPVERLARLDAWLERFDAPNVVALVAEARAGRAAARREVPLLRVALRGEGIAFARWLPDGGFVSWTSDLGHELTVHGPDGEVRRRVDVELDIECVVLSPDGRRALVGGRSRQEAVLLLELGASGARRQVDGVGTVLCAAWQADGALVAVGLDDGRLRVLDGASGQVVHDLEQRGSPIRALVFGADGRLLAGSGDPVDAKRHDNAVIIWRLSPAPSRAATIELPSMPNSLWVDPAGRTFAIGTSGGRLYLRAWQRPDDPPIELSGEGTKDAGVVSMFVSTPPAHAAAVRAIALLPGGRVVTVCGERETTAEQGLRVWSLDPPAELPALRRTSRFPLYGVDVAPDGRLLVGGLGGAVEVWSFDE